MAVFSPSSLTFSPAFLVICVQFSVTQRWSTTTQNLSLCPLQFAVLDVQCISRMLPPGHWGSASQFNYGFSSPWLPLTWEVQSRRGALPFRISIHWQPRHTGGDTQIPSLTPAGDPTDLLCLLPHPSHRSLVTWFLTYVSEKPLNTFNSMQHSTVGWRALSKYTLAPNRNLNTFCLLLHAFKQ